MDRREKVQKVLEFVDTAMNVGGTVLEYAFLYAYVPTILYLGSKSTEKGILQTLFPVS